MVHWRLVGSAPPDETIDTVNATAEPGVALPDDMDMVTCCALARPAATTATQSHNAQRATEPKPRRFPNSEIRVRA